MLTTEEVKHLAKISNLKLTDQEIETYRLQLTEIFEYVKTLNSVDTDNVEPTFHVTSSKNRFQSASNNEKETLTNDLALKNAKKTFNGYIVGKSKLKG